MHPTVVTIMCICKTYHSDFSSSVELTVAQARSTHIDLDLIVDFDRSVLSGHVNITCRASQAGPCNLTLDSRDLEIQGITLVPCSLRDFVEPLEYSVSESGHSATLGSPIQITLPAAKEAGETYTVRIVYTTTKSGSALQWLTKEQTSSKKYPFMFSQCQAIHARSMLPCQDLCQVKVTYSATVRHPSTVTALMSAERVGAPETADGWTVSKFEQKVAIPAYLIAIVCGELESRRIGPRSCVWAEPSVVDKAAWEFADTEKMIEVAEKLCGPYRFGIYDLLVLPPSFPYGGMENPCLTFCTPTLLAGDRSQTAVIAHELAHSWSGNLVTNKTWTDFWINEGLTVFTESKIVEALFGSEAASVRKQEGWDHLHQYVSEMGETHNFTRLCPRQSKGDDPDDAFSVVPYEKGASLFWHLQSVTGRDRFEKFIVNFFNTFAQETVSSDDLREFCKSELGEAVAAVDWTAWFDDPGMPSYKPPVDMAAIEEAHTVAKHWLSSTFYVPDESVSGWPSGKKCILINQLLESKTKLTPDKLSLMAASYKFLETNCEVRCAFITLILRSLPEDADLTATAKAAAVQLATEQGRMKFTRPMYRELVKVDRPLAKATFAANKSSYHPICSKMVQKDLA